MASKRGYISARELIPRGPKKNYDEDSLAFETQHFMDMLLGRTRITEDLGDPPAYTSKVMEREAQRSFIRMLKQIK